MKLKQAILTIMDRDTLKAVVDDLEIEDVDRRSIEDMRAKVSSSRRAEPEMLMAHLSEKQVKAVCEQMGVSPKGRRKELMERLLGIWYSGNKAAAARSEKKNPKTKIKKYDRKPGSMVDKHNTRVNEHQPARRSVNPAAGHAA
ncbi:MAG: hypothetical protein U5R30_04400 [Deltaproteobacteria bacterium]|nr:hypothetical protein [Deltaproteobacteria bacterium]